MTYYQSKSTGNIYDQPRGEFIPDDVLPISREEAEAKLQSPSVEQHIEALEAQVKELFEKPEAQA